ncbi:unnamed protein product [Urochloa humidicola]
MADAAVAINPTGCGQAQPPHTAVSRDAIEETVLNGGTKAVEADLLWTKSNIFRFPSNLRSIGRERDYIAPRTVAIGPYYHGMAELQEMEDVKHTAVDSFFHGLAIQSREAAYKKIVPITCNARACYADGNALQGISYDKFATMMFVDGCFLVQFMAVILGRKRGNSLLRSMIQPHLLGIMRDIMLLENQIPWPVVQFFLNLRPLPLGEIIGFLDAGLCGSVSRESLVLDIDEHHKPSHLLCLIRHHKVGSSKRVLKATPRFSGRKLTLSTSAAELSEIGIKLKASETAQFSAMDIVKGAFCAKLYLPPLHLDTVTTCWLVNMAAFEMCTETSWTDECSVNSFLSVLSLLMNQKDDVRQLRVKRILDGLSDKQTLEFFKSLSPNLLVGYAYFEIIVGLEEYRHKRRLWIAIYRFLYNNATAIATVLSVLGVLVGIFKTLFSLKQHQQ